jgi:hypothetical protein
MEADTSAALGKIAPGRLPFKRSIAAADAQQDAESIQPAR